MIWYTAISGFIFLFLSFVWQKNDWLNLFVKVLFFGLALWAGFQTFQQLGFIVKVA